MPGCRVESAIGSLPSRSTRCRRKEGSAEITGFSFCVSLPAPRDPAGKVGFRRTVDFPAELSPGIAHPRELQARRGLGDAAGHQRVSIEAERTDRVAAL